MNLPSEVVLDHMSVPDPLESDYNLRVMLHYNHCRDGAAADRLTPKAAVEAIAARGG